MVLTPVVLRVSRFGRHNPMCFCSDRPPNPNIYTYIKRNVLRFSNKQQTYSDNILFCAHSGFDKCGFENKLCLVSNLGLRRRTNVDVSCTRELLANTHPEA